MRPVTVYFRKKKTPIAPIIINGGSTEKVDCYKNLGTIISSDLGWENNTDAVVKQDSTTAVLRAPTKEVRACPVLSFCY